MPAPLMTAPLALARVVITVIFPALLSGLGASLAAPASAASDDHRQHLAQVSPQESRLAEGLVKKVDKAAGKLTVAHGPLPNGMAAMTMAFKVKDPALLDRVKEGQKIRFDIDEAMTITRIEAVK